ncbi:BREX system serine/threonine kinase PglW [Pseudoclavibacter helvolus]|uniref:BREX system serine/threonine kinase PglW n=1 Tax=Pseudoclavibacter helvolus TaxID=255205 RepID=UPI003735E82E
MKADSPHWIVMGQPATPAEEAALDAFRELLPEDGITTAWVNLTFIDNNGRSGEIDVLLLTRSGLHIVELKGWHGRIVGNTQRWLHNARNVENPWLATDRKAKRLAELLKDVAPNEQVRKRVPFLHSKVVLHGHSSVVELEQRATLGVLAMDKFEVKAKPALVRVSTFVAELPSNPNHVIDWQRAKAIRALCEVAGFKATPKTRMVGDYKVADSTPIAEGPDWQDVLVDNPHLSGVKLRLRLRDLPQKASASDRRRIEDLAQREYQLTYGIRHDGIDVPTEFKKTDDGPALVFEYDDSEQPLDAYIASHPDLSFEQRMAMVIRLGETIRFAHQRHLIHRALGPRRIWVRLPSSKDAKSLEARLSIRDWYSGQKDRSSSSETRWTTISAGVTDIMGTAAHEDWIYLAPESRVPSHNLPGIPLDIYSFGAVAHLILTGRPPAENLVDLEQKLTQERALDPRSVVAGIPDEVAEVIVFITSATETDRPSTMAEVLDYLHAAWDGVRKVDATEAPNDVEDPLDAQSGDAVADRFLVLARRGEGSTGVAFAVNDMDSADSDRKVVLKVSRTTSADKRLKAEGEVLRALDHKRIVRLLDGPMQIAERCALLLSDAGKETLAVRLAKEGRSTLGQLQRFGSDLLDAMVYLETKGFFHRDIKPANLGITPDPGTRKPSLVLFDFSLSDESVDKISSGTPGYLDPYLGRGVRKRYDRAAELYAVSATLFEMATGGLPWWANGNSQPMSPDDEPVVEPTAFEPAVAAQFAQLFRKALHPKAKSRFSSADELATAWHEIFVTLDSGDETAEANQELAEAAVLDTLLEKSGLSARARSAAARLDVTTVGGLLGVHPTRINSIRGLGESYRKEIQARIKQWRARLRVPTEVDDAFVAKRGVERVLFGLLEPLSGSDRVAVDGLLRLTSEAAGPRLNWPATAEVAQSLGQTREQVVDTLDRAVATWAKKKELAGVHEDAVTILARQGRVMTVSALALALAAQRGSLLDGAERALHSAALLRLVFEYDTREPEPALELRRSAKRPALIALHGEIDPDGTGRDFPLADVLIDAAAELGRAADTLVGSTGVVPYAVAAQSLRSEIVDTAAWSVMTDDRRLVRLAADASETVELSGFDELYPTTLKAQAAVELALSGKPGRRISEGAVRRSVQARFPGVALPAHSRGLDPLVEAALPGMVRRDGIYEPASTRPTTVTGTAATMFGTIVTATPGAEVVGRLGDSLGRRSALTLCVSPSRYLRQARELGETFKVDTLDVSHLIVEATKEMAAAHGIDWGFVVGADAKTREGSDWANLTRLVQSAVEPRWSAALATDRPVLLTHAGPLQRYGLGHLLATMLDVGTKRPAARWLLVAMQTSQTVPMLGGKPVPIAPSGWLVLPSELPKEAPYL